MTRRAPTPDPLLDPATLLSQRMILASLRGDKDLFYAAWDDLNVVCDEELDAEGVTTAMCRVVMLLAASASTALRGAENVYGGDTETAETQLLECILEIADAAAKAADQ